MPMKKNSGINKKIQLKLKREEMLSQGAYDGRYKNKIVSCKKKKKSKIEARKWRFKKDDN